MKSTQELTIDPHINSSKYEFLSFQKYNKNNKNAFFLRNSTVRISLTDLNLNYKTPSYCSLTV